MFFSASQLCKQSAAQIKFLRDKPKRPPTEQMLKGDKFADASSISELIEMSGCYYRNGNAIHFSVDEVRELKGKIHLIEHKMVTGHSNDEYFKSCIIQTAFYGCLTSLVPSLRTASWAKGEEHFMNLEQLRSEGFSFHSFLNFGGRKYRINYEIEPIMRFFLTKARATLAPYEVTKRFDAAYRNEWEYFRKCIKYRKA